MKLLVLLQTSITQKFEAHGMFSADGEYVEFSHPTLLEGPVETWLCDIERMMRWTLKEVLKSCRVALKKNLSKRDKWIKDWCGQVCLFSTEYSIVLTSKDTCIFFAKFSTLMCHFL